MGELVPPVLPPPIATEPKICPCVGKLQITLPVPAEIAYIFISMEPT